MKISETLPLMLGVNALSLLLLTTVAVELLVVGARSSTVMLTNKGAEAPPGPVATMVIESVPV